MNKLHTLKMFTLIIALAFTFLLIGCVETSENTYYINFIVNDNVYKTIVVKENETIDSNIYNEIKPSLDGYEFIYWLDGDKKFEESQKITKDLNLKAYFEKIIEKVVITIKSNDEVVDTIEINKGEKLAKPSDLVLEGYIFKGFYLGDELYDFDKPVEENITLQAKWEEEVKYITIKLYDGEKLVDTINTMAGSEIELKKLNKEGYTFLGWSYLDNLYNDKVSLNEDASLQAKWEVTKYTISFYDKGELITTREVEHGKDLVDVPSYTKNGYEFMGWDQELTNITSDLTVYADYYAVEYSITYHNCDKTSNVKKYTIESRPISLLDAEKEGYVFGGWYLEADFKTKVEVIETGTYGDLDLYARYLNTYDVSFALDGGEFSNSVIDSYKLKQNTLSEFVITQYNTNYWELYKNNIFLMTKESEPKAIYSYRVGLKYTDGLFVISSLVKSGGSSDDLGDCDYVIVVAETNTSGCKELNFSSLSVGYKLSLNADITTLTQGDVNLKALLFTNSLSEYKGSILEEQELPTPKKKKYIFKGWMTPENEIITKITNYSGKEITLKAIWEKAEGTEYEIDMLSDEIIEKIGRVVSKNIELPTFNEEYNATITWATSNENIISLDGKVTRPFGDNRTCTLTMTITIKDVTRESSVTVIVPRGYKNISEGGIIAGYNYTSVTPSDVTLREVDILYCAFGNVGADGHITNYSSIGSNVSSYIDKAHSYGDYVILSLNTSSLAIAASKQETIDVLVNDCIKVINNFGLDGIDVDWETPTQETKENYTALMKTLYTKVKANNPEHLVTTATAAGPWQYPRFDLENSIKYIDYINLMAYDLQTNSKATHQSALYKSTKGYTLGQCTIDETLPLYNKVNVPNEKIIVGLPFYGRKFKDTEGIGQSSSADGACTQSYIYENYLSKTVEGVTIGFDEECKVPYIYDANKKLFISYDNERSIRIKTEYIASKGLAGMMYWQDGQDYNNKLLNAIYANKTTMTSKR